MRPPTPHLMVVSTATATVPEMGQTAMADGFVTFGRRYTVTAADRVPCQKSNGCKACTDRGRINRTI